MPPPRGPCRPLLLAALAATAALVALVAAEEDGDGVGGAGVEVQALAVGNPAELMPGTIVGRGSYVLVEKLCDIHHPSASAQAPHSLPRLPPPSDRLLLVDPAEADGSGAGGGQLVPYEGLAQAIARALPQLPMSPSQVPGFLPAVYEYAVSVLRGDPLFEEAWRYRFGQRLGRGAFGEAWRAVSLDGSMREVVLKRLFVEKGEHVRRSGEREIYFGTVLQHRPHISRFIESFEHHAAARAGPGAADPAGAGAGGGSGEGRGAAKAKAKAKAKAAGRTRPPSELWLVFHNEGFSMTHHLFRTQPGSLVVELSAFWWHIKSQQPLGGQVIKNIVYQLLHAVAVVHELNITHRDVKGGNVFVTDTWPPVVRLGDWGSALTFPPTDEVGALYGEEGPTEDDETDGYRPPEAVFDEELLGRLGIERAGPWRTQAYDLWSFGVLLLELILGTREVFRVDERRWLRASHHLQRQCIPSERLLQGRRLLALLDLCIAPRGAPRGASLSWFFDTELQAAEAACSERRSAKAASLALEPGGGRQEEPWCTDEEFAKVLRERDAAGVGLPSAEGRDLLRRLLAWSPEDRIQARSALAHSWFDDGAKLPPLRAIRPLGYPSGEGAARGGETADGAAAFPADVDEMMDWRLAAAARGTRGNETESESTPCLEAEAVADGGTSSSGALASGCPGLQLHVAVQGDVGRRADMEDRHAALNLSSGDCGGRRSAVASFVGVYDGHSGDRVAEKLRVSLHQHLMADPAFPENVSAALWGAFRKFDGLLVQEASRNATDRGVANASAPKRQSSSKALQPFRDPGSTALVAVASGCRLHIANLGDCRAVAARREGRPSTDSAEDSAMWPLGALVEVREAPQVELRGQRGLIVEVRSTARRLYVVRLLRDGALRPLRQSALRLLSELRARRLTEDHKPGSEAERRRIEALGGEVELPTKVGGLARVAGIATSRSFGSLAARPLISVEPDVFEYPLDPQRDVFLVLASDGIWDVLDDQLVVDLIWDQVSSVHDSRLGPEAVLADAAQLIVQTAMERGSVDNLTCAIVLLTWAP